MPKDFVTQEMLESGRRLAEAIPVAQAGLLDCGWCITLSFNHFLIVYLGDALSARDHATVDAVMAEFTRREVPGIERRLYERFDARKPVLADAFDAHRSRKFTLSVPVFLAQADGIGREILRVSRQFFSRSRRLEALERKTEDFVLFGHPHSVPDPYRMLIDQLRFRLSVAEDTDERSRRQQAEPWFGPLNRHAVLHGNESDYGTEVNSLRCILFLEHLLDMDQILNKDIPEELAGLNRSYNEAMAYFAERDSA